MPAINMAHRQVMDHFWQHDLASDVDHFLGAGRQNISVHSGDLALADGDVPDAIPPEAGSMTRPRAKAHRRWR